MRGIIFRSEAPIDFGVNARDPSVGARLPPGNGNPLPPKDESGQVVSAKERRRYSGIATVK
jgi:hypothetical protein